MAVRQDGSSISLISSDIRCHLHSQWLARVSNLQDITILPITTYMQTAIMEILPLLISVRCWCSTSLKKILCLSYSTSKDAVAIQKNMHPLKTKSILPTLVQNGIS